MIDYTHANAPFLVGFPRPEIFRRIYLGAIYAPFRERFLRALARCIARGVLYWPEFGFRPMALQALMHADWLAGKGGRAAPAGLSAHLYGLAIDVSHDRAPDVPGLQPDWVPEHYDILVEEMEREGLVSGKSFGDLPHVQWPGFVDGHQLGVLLRLWQSLRPELTDDAKLQRIWAYLDTLPHPPSPSPA